MSTSLLEDALSYSQRGISCIPISQNKKPPIKWKQYQKQRPNHQEVRDFFALPGVTGVAVISGAVSGGLAIRDYDTCEEYESFREKNPALAKTLPTVRTYDGFHQYCRSNLEHIVDVENGEYRGAGYTLAPYSLHPNGTRYEWIIPLPHGELPEVDSKVFLGDKTVTECTERTEAINSVVSVPSAVSVTSSDPESIIKSTLPTKPGERNSCVMNLARGMKFNAGLANADADTLRALVRRWHTLALPNIKTKSFDETWSDFLHAFAGARYPLGINFVDEAADRIDPDDLPAIASNYDTIPARQLIGLCYQLSRLNPDGCFFLSCHDAARRVKLKPMEVWRLFGMFKFDRVIKCSEKGHEYRANRYRWIGGGE